MGHEVDQRVVTIGEDLEEYDRVIVFLHNPAGFAGFLYNGLWAIYARPDCIMAYDDWQIDSITKGLESLCDPEKLFRDYVKDGCKEVPENVEQYQDELIGAIQLIGARENDMLISAFAGGDLSLIIDYPADKLFSYNPNPYHLHRQAESRDKKRIFNFAGLVQGKTQKWLKKQNVESTGWELKLYGSRKDGQDRVTEDEMVNLYGEHWGILMAGYHHAGSGWWRARPTQVADAGSILIGEPKEMMLYYNDDFLSTLTPQMLAEMDDEELEAIAEGQRLALYLNHPLDKSVQQAELTKVLK
jgi:hypothetical protein